MSRFLLVGYDAFCSRLENLLERNFNASAIVKVETLEEGVSLLKKSCSSIGLALIDVEGLGSRPMKMAQNLPASNPTVRFIVILSFDNRDYVEACLGAGFHGLLCKRQSDVEILTALQEIRSGRIYLPWHFIHQQNSPAQTHNTFRLTPRQDQVLRLLALGMSNKEIAHTLRIAESTTKIHTAMLIRTLGVRNRTEAAFKAGKLFGNRSA